MNENWKDIEGYKGLYQISSNGAIRSLDRDIKYKTGRIQHIKGKIRKLKINNRGYQIVSLFKNDKEKTFLVHRLVALHFLPNPKNLNEVNHIDENKLRNCVDNLEWCNRKYNCNYGDRNKIMGEKHKKAIIQFDENYNYIKLWDCAKTIANELKYDSSNIARCCNNKQKLYKNFKWGYEKDFEKISFKVFDITIYEKRVA